MGNFENIRLPWPDWKIVRYLGGGAYGKVYEIERTISGMQEKEKAALKIVSRPKDEDEIEEYEVSGYDKESIMESYKSEIQNYVQEYKLMRTLQGQTNIVSCDDFTVVWNQNGIGGKVFIRMELLTPLNQMLKERTLSTEEIIKLGKDISSALILCEKKNIIHRDIKPANIMVSQFGNYKLGDFGVSKIMDHATYATAMGTPEYQAPEVVHMGKYGQTADIYSLGITLYWLLNNRRMPFIGVNEQLNVERKNEAIDRRYNKKEKLPAPKNGSAKLKKIVLKACEYNPEDRYASAQEMYDDLDTLRLGKTTGGTSSTGKKKGTSGTQTGTKSKTSVTEETDYGNDVTVRPEEVSFDDGKTGGNSWRDGTVTIEKTPRKTPKTGASNFQDEPEKKTEGVKDAYQRQKEKEKKKERTTVVADVPVQAKKKSGGLQNILVILIVIVIGIAVGGYKVFITDGGKLFKSSSSTYAGYETKTEYYDYAKTKIKTTTSYKNGTMQGQTIYNEDGTEQKLVDCDEKGIIESEYLYNEDGQCYKLISHDEKGEIAYWIESKYNERGEKVKDTTYRADGSVWSITEYQWLEDGRRGGQTDTSYDENGNITGKRVCEFDENENFTKETYYNMDGTMDCYNIYEYDSRNNWTKKTSYDGAGKITTYFTKEYDSDNNLVKETNYDGAGNIQDYSIYEESKLIPSMRDYTKYDANGNIIEYGKYVEGDRGYYCKKYDANWNEIEE